MRIHAFSGDINKSQITRSAWSGFLYYFYLFIYYFGCTGSLLMLHLGFLTVGTWASHCGGFFCRGASDRERRRRSCGLQAELLCSMWDLPGPGIKPVSLHWQMDS